MFKKLAAYFMAALCAATLAVPASAETPEASQWLKEAVFLGADQDLAFFFVEGTGDRVGDDQVKSGKTVYLLLYSYTVLDQYAHDFSLDFSTDDIDLTVKKKDGASHVSSAKVLQKRLPDDAVDLPAGLPLGDDSRWQLLEIKLKEFPEDEQYRLTFKLTAKAEKDLDMSPLGYGVIPKGTRCEMETAPFWVGNQLFEGDLDTAPGDGGIVIKPAQNDDNEICWEDENNTVARLLFSADSDVGKFCPKLSTRWTDRPYKELFEGQDAYLYDFWGNPELSAASRAELSLRHPFAEQKGKPVIYEVSGETLKDVTSAFTSGTDDNGDPVLKTRTRRLGTYIVAEYPLDEVE